MDMISFREEVLRLIAFRQEGEYWDFKKEWHKNKPEPNNKRKKLDTTLAYFPKT